MLNLNCIICAELFGQSDDVHVTVCGHMFHYLCLTQWLERSKTCPQCRNKCSESKIIKIYFNLANLDASRIDIGSLHEQLDNLKLQLQIKEKELHTAETQIKTLKESQKKCMKTITCLEAKVQKNDFVILSYVEQLKLLKTDAKATAELRKELKSLKQQIETMEGVSSILTASNAEAENLLKVENDPKKLSVWLTTLKRELRNSESKKTDLRNMLRVVQNDLRREIDSKKKLEERISQLESESYQLNEKLNELQTGTSKSSGQFTTKTFGPSLNESLQNLMEDENRLKISPSIKENVRKIEDSDSPYLRIKSSSIGLMPYAFKRNAEALSNSRDANSVHTTTKLAVLKISPTKATISSSSGLVRKTSSDLTEKYSIFKKPRLGLASSSIGIAKKTASVPKEHLKSNFVYNGFGGSDKIDLFEKNNSEDKTENNDELMIHRPLKASKSDIGFRVHQSVATNPPTLSERLKTGHLRNFAVIKK